MKHRYLAVILPRPGLNSCGKTNGPDIRVLQDLEQSPSIKTTSRQLTTANKLSFVIIWIHNNNRILSSKCSGKFKSVYWFLRPAQKTSICCNTTRHQPLIEQTQRHEHQPSHKSQWSRPPGCTWGICPSSNTSGVTAPQRAIARGQLLKKEPKFKLNLEAFSCVIWAFPQIPHVNWSETSRTTPSAVTFSLHANLLSPYVIKGAFFRPSYSSDINRSPPRSLQLSQLRETAAGYCKQATKKWCYAAIHYSFMIHFSFSTGEGAIRNDECIAQDAICM